MILNIEIKNKIASYTGTDEIVCGNSDYVLRFSFDEEWESVENKTARFCYVKSGMELCRDVLFSGTECEVPPLYDVMSVRVGVIAGDIRTTTPALINCRRSIACYGAALEGYSKDAYNQLLNKYEELLRITAENKEQTVYSRQLYASVVKNTIQGRCVSAADVSPVDHLLNVKVSSANLITYPYMTKTELVTDISSDYDPYMYDSDIPLNGAEGFDECLTSDYLVITDINKFIEKLKTYGITFDAGETKEFSINTLSEGPGNALYYNGQLIAKGGLDEIGADEFYNSVVFVDEWGIYVNYIDRHMTAKFRVTSTESYSTTINGVTFTVAEDGTITANGTATAQIIFWLMQSEDLAKENETYTISGCAGGNDSSWMIQVSCGGAYPTTHENGISFVAKSNIISVYIVVRSGVILNNVVFKPQLEEGSTSTEYTPYVDISTANVSRTGKNLISYPYYETTKTLSNVTFTDNGDGTLLVNGTATADVYFTLHNKDKKTLFLIKGQVYTLNALPIVGSYSTIYAYVTESDGSQHFEIGESITFTANSTGYASLSFVIAAGFVANNLVIKPQLEVGSIVSEYESYKGSTNYKINADGTVEGVTSLYPTTTLYTDTDGVVLDVEYNVDTKKYIDNKFAELAAMIVNS